MTGPEHYQAAEAALAASGEAMDADWGMWASMSTDERLARQAAYLAQAQVHATLALAAATATGASDHPAADWDEWFRTASAMPALLRRQYAPDDDDEPEPEVQEHDPGPEVDDEGGMSEYRHLPF